MAVTPSVRAALRDAVEVGSEPVNRVPAAVPSSQSGPTLAPTVAPAPTLTPTPTSTGSRRPERAYDHVVVVVLENHSFESVAGHAEAPFLNSFAARNALATGYSGISHPSLPNYLALTAGSTFGITTDCTRCFIDGPNLADSVDAAGLTWRSYNESIPAPCFAGDAYPYVQKHDPFYYYNSIRASPQRCSNIVPLTTLAADFAATATAPAYSLVTPNMCNDGHDCPLATTDAWLARFVPSLLATPGFSAGRSLLIVTYDEGEGGSDRVFTLLAGSGVKAGFTSARPYNHYSLLRTVEFALGLGAVGPGDSAASPMTEFIGAG